MITNIIYQYISIIILYILLYIPNIQLSYVVILFRLYILFALIADLRDLQNLQNIQNLQNLQNITYMS